MSQRKRRKRLANERNVWRSTSTGRFYIDRLCFHSSCESDKHQREIIEEVSQQKNMDYTDEDERRCQQKKRH